MELNADMIIVSLEFGKEEEISSIREYENETNDIEGKTYVYVTEDMQMEWTKDMYYKFYDALEKAASVMTVE